MNIAVVRNPVRHIDAADRINNLTVLKQHDHQTITIRVNNIIPVVALKKVSSLPRRTLATVSFRPRKERSLRSRLSLFDSWLFPTSHQNCVLVYDSNVVVFISRTGSPYIPIYDVLILL